MRDRVVCGNELRLRRWLRKAQTDGANCVDMDAPVASRVGELPVGGPRPMGGAHIGTSARAAEAQSSQQGVGA